MTQVLSQKRIGTSYSPNSRRSGSKKSHYMPSSTLGIGTYGQVFKCFDTQIKEDVAIKVANREPAYRRSALNESSILQRLHGVKEVVRWIDTFEDCGQICIVTELLARNLLEAMKDRSFRPLPLNDTRAVITNVLRALAATHDFGYMHCDVKPENVMLRSLETGPASAVLIDFGAVRALPENAYFDIQSLWYRAPEVLCNVPYTPKIDAWSAGCLLFELATGAPLFPGNTPQDQLQRIVGLLGSPSQEACAKGGLPFAPGPNPAARAAIDEKIRTHHGDGPASDLMIHLLYGLLNPDEKLRLSCAMALEHPFILNQESTNCFLDQIFVQPEPHGIWGPNNSIICNDIQRNNSSNYSNNTSTFFITPSMSSSSSFGNFSNISNNFVPVQSQSIMVSVPNNNSPLMATPLNSIDNYNNPIPISDHSPCNSDNSPSTSTKNKFATPSMVPIPVPLLPPIVQWNE